MKTIIYKKVLGRYEIEKINDRGGDKILVEFCEPIDSKLTVAGRVFPVERGVARIDAKRLPDGELSPKLYTDGAVSSIEGFILSHGAIVRINVTDDYVRKLVSVVDELQLKVRSLEENCRKIQKKIDQPLQF